MGVDGVVVVGCRDDGKFDCPYKEAGYWIRKKVEHAQAMLNAIGLGAERLFFTELSGMETAAFGETLESAKAQFKEAGASPLR